MESIFRITTFVSAVLLVLFILIQKRGASLGAGFGGSNEIHTTRRGVDKTVHQITIIFAIVFVLSILLNIVLSR